MVSHSCTTRIVFSDHYRPTTAFYFTTGKTFTVAEGHGGPLVDASML